MSRPENGRSAVVRAWRVAAGMALVPSAPGCEALQVKPPAPYDVVFRVDGDPGKPLAGAVVLRNGQQVAETRDDGLARLRLRGEEGETLFFDVKCPAPHRSPAKPIAITLRRLADPTKFPEYLASCPPSTRTVVVAVRAENGGNLPVMYLGRELARTDQDGAAHVALTLRPEETFQLMLKTAGEDAGKDLRPQDPVTTFVVKNRDEVLSLSQEFVVQPRPRVVRPPRPQGPTPLKTK